LTLHATETGLSSGSVSHQTACEDFPCKTNMCDLYYSLHKNGSLRVPIAGPLQMNEMYGLLLLKTDQKIVFPLQFLEENCQPQRDLQELA